MKQKLGNYQRSQANGGGERRQSKQGLTTTEKHSLNKIALQILYIIGFPLNWVFKSIYLLSLFLPAQPKNTLPAKNSHAGAHH